MTSVCFVMGNWLGMFLSLKVKYSSITNSDRLQPARPEDLVLLTVTSHEYADEKGDFYLFPFDIGPGQTKAVTPELRNRAISSDDLSHRLRDVNAGELVLIVDACHREMRANLFPE